MQASPPAIPRFDDARVLVAGDVMLDEYWHGDTSRVSPEAPVPVVHVRDRGDARPGGAANVAVNVAMLGARPTLLGLVGEDEAAGTLETLLRERGVECRWLFAPGHETTRKLRVLSRHQQLIRLDIEDHAGARVPASTHETYVDLLAGADAVVLSDYGKGLLADATRFIEAARDAATPVLVDPKGTDFSRYRGATVITPNQFELEAVVGACPDLAALSARAQALCASLSIEAMLVTRGEHGMTLVRPGQAPLHLAALAREVYDVTGAGDTVIGVVAAALSAGSSLPECMALANHAAGIVVGKLGTAGATVAELESALRKRAVPRVAVVDERELGTALRAARAAGEIVVMTNGCFDILHAGHIDSLGRARALGDRLVVAVNDDDSVRRLKGAGRPINALADRMEVLAALACVDWVVPFATDTPRDLICRLLPDVLVKGGDYVESDVAGGDCVRAHGGRVEILALRAGRSTSGVIAAAGELAATAAGTGRAAS